jgi:hypothetical protein
MKKTKVWLGLVLILALTLPWQILAAKDDGEQRSDDGRQQVIGEFADIREAEWAEESIKKMQAKQVLSGYPDGSFRPNQPVTRIEAIVTAVRLMGLEEEAQADASSETTLHFKDAKLLEEKYAWAKGYVIAALRHGLFDPADDRIQPDKPASRVWVSALLVRALGLENEALERMTEVPDFADSAAIPAGSVGYVNAAVQEGIVSGYPDQTFKPNKPVTRAEMAAFLDRANDGLLDSSGAFKVRGTITAIGFTTEGEGTITIKSVYGESSTYQIAPDAPVQYQRDFITANQLQVEELVILTVRGNTVIEAVLLDQETAPEETAAYGILELKMEIELADDASYELKYKLGSSKAAAKIEQQKEGGKIELTGEEAVQAAEALLAQLALTPDMDKETIVQRVLHAQGIENGAFRELEIKVNFANGKKVDIELENESGRADDGEAGQDEEQRQDDNESRGGDDLREEDGLAEGQIREFSLKLKLSNQQTWEAKYEIKKNRVKAEVKDGKNKVTGREAAETVETILEQLRLSDGSGRDEVLKSVFAALQVDPADVQSAEIEVKFADGAKFEVEYEADDKQNNSRGGKKEKHKKDDEDDDDGEDDDDDGEDDE